MFLAAPPNDEKNPPGDGILSWSRLYSEASETGVISAVHLRIVGFRVRSNGTSCISPALLLSDSESATKSGTGGISMESCWSVRSASSDSWTPASDMRSIPRTGLSSMETPASEPKSRMIGSPSKWKLLV